MSRTITDEVACDERWGHVGCDTRPVHVIQGGRWLRLEATWQVLQLRACCAAWASSSVDLYDVARSHVLIC